MREGEQKRPRIGFADAGYFLYAVRANPSHPEGDRKP